MTVITRSKLPSAGYRDSVEVEPPFEFSTRVLVTQAYGDDDPSHEGVLFYAIDFATTGTVSDGLPGIVFAMEDVVDENGLVIEKYSGDGIGSKQPGHHYFGNFMNFQSSYGIYATIAHLQSGTLNLEDGEAQIGDSGDPTYGIHAHIHYGTTISDLYGDTYYFADASESLFAPVRYDTALGTVFQGIIAKESVDVEGAPSAFIIGRSSVEENIFLLGGADLSITANDSANILSGNRGSNVIEGHSGADAIWAGEGNDRVFGERDDSTSPEGDNDTIFGGLGDDQISGGGGDDWIFGDSGECRIRAADGGTLTAEELSSIEDAGFSLADLDDGLVDDGPVDHRYGTHIIDSGLGYLIARSDGADDLRGDAGNDTIFGGAGNDTIYGGGTSSLVPNEPIRENDILFGGAGDDLIFGELGNDTIFGGSGEDIAVVARLDDPDSPSVFTIAPDGDGIRLTHHVLNGAVIDDGDDGSDLLYDVEFVSFGSQVETYKVSVDVLRGYDYVFRGGFFNHEQVKAEFEGNGLVLTDIISLTGSPEDYAFDRTPDGFITVTAAAPQVLGAMTMAATAVSGGTTLKVKANYFQFADVQEFLSATEIVTWSPGPADDHGDTRVDATPLTSISAVADVFATIEQAGDKDYFSFSTVLGHKYTVLALPFASAVDPQIKVFNSYGSLIDANQDMDGQPRAAGLSFFANGETYYVEVSSENGTTGDYALAISDYTADTTGGPPGGGVPGLDVDIPTVTWDYEGDNSDENVSYLTSDPYDRYVATLGGEDTVRTGRGNDVVLAGDDDDVVSTGDGNDTVAGEGGYDEIDGGDGHDALLGGDGEDTIDGGEGNDTIGGGRHDDTIRGRDGDDILVGEHGDDYISGGDGRDSISGGEDRDDLRGGNGDDLIYGGLNDDEIRGDADNDNLNGGDGDDLIRGGDGNDSISGDDDDDIIYPGTGNDTVDGGPGSDWVRYDDENGGAWIDIGGEFARGEEIGFDIIESIDHVTGTRDNDVIIGDHDENEILGDGGADRITGGGGNDTIDGGSGNDTVVYTGNRADYTITAATDPNYDYIITDNRDESPDGTDLLVSTDKLEFADATILDNDVFSTAPTANADAYQIWSYRPAVFDVLANDTDPEGDPLTIVAITSLPVSANAHVVDDKIVFDPGEAFDYLVPDERTTVEVTYRVTDGMGWFSEATVVLDVVAPRDGALIPGSPDADRLEGTWGADIIEGFEGADTLLGGLGNDFVDGGDGDDSLDGGDGYDTLTGGVGQDTLLGGAGADVLDGGDGDDSLDGGDGNDTLSGAEGQDTLHGGSGTDSLEGGTGNDLLTGNGDGVFQGGGGNDTITITSRNYGSQATAIVVDGGDDDDQIDLYAENFTYSYDDGYNGVYTYHGHVAVLGGTGNDTVTATLRTATAEIDTGEGEDEISVRVADDTFPRTFQDTALSITTGTGRDTIRPERMHWQKDLKIEVTDFAAGAGGDVLDLTVVIESLRALYDGWDGATNPFAAGYLAFQQQGADTLLQILDSGTWYDVLVLRGVTATDLTAENVTPFAPDGSPLAGEHIPGSLDDDTLEGGWGGDTIEGFAGSDDIQGGYGNDLIEGGDGDDFMWGNFGNDTLLGGQGHDFLAGGYGTDSLDGGDGDDRLIGYGDGTFQGATGNDTITIQNTRANAILVDGGDDDDLIDVYAKNYSYSYVYDYDTQTYSYNYDYQGHVTILGGAGNDTITGNLGTASVEIDAGAGDDVISGGVIGDGVALDITTGTGRDIIRPVGLTWSKDLNVEVADFTTGAGGDVIDLSAALTQLLSDASWYGLTLGWDVSTNPFATGFLAFEQQGADTVLRLFYDGTWNDQMVLRGVTATDLTTENVTPFPPDGSPPSGELITGSPDDDSLQGTLVNDTIEGLAGDDTIRGGYGDDLLDGGDGDDDLFDYQGANTFLGGAGADRIRALLRNERAALHVDGGDGDDDIDVYAYYYDYYGSEPNLIVTVFGGADNDTILVALEGFDAAIDGGTGDDAISVRLSAGTSVEIATGEGRDMIRLDDIYSGADATVTDFAAGAGGDVLDLADAQYRLGWFGWDGVTNPFSLGLLQFVQVGPDSVLQSWSFDGWVSLLTLRDVTASGLTADNILQGFAPDGGGVFGQEITGTDIADPLDGAGGDDTIRGLGGTDYVNAYDGNDLLEGGTGNDVMTGGPGADRFRASIGMGDDVITDFEIGEAGVGDRIDLAGLGISFEDIVFTSTADGLRVDLPVGSFTLRGVTSTELGLGDFTGFGLAPVLTDPGALAVEENRTFVATLAATDPDGDALSFSIAGGRDAGHFAVDPATGALRFVDVPDFEAPGDVNGDNVYEVTVEVTDPDGAIDSQALTVEVTDTTLTDDPVLWFADADGNLAGLTDGDVLPGFGSDDALRVTGMGLAAGGVTVTSTTASLAVDTTGDGTPDTTVTLEGDFEGESLELFTQGGETTVQLAGPGASQASAAGERFITTDPGPNRVFGDAGDDVAVTGGGADLISSGAGADVIIAGDGDDILIGGLGPDKLTGGAGADIFAFSAADFDGFTADFITDFTPGEDVIELAGFGVTELGDLSFVTVTQGDAIDLGSGRFIVLEGLTAADLLPGDVIGADPRAYALVSAGPVHRLTEADDRFISTDIGPSEIIGRAGADAIVGGSGDDIIRGEGGADVLLGGAGNDTLIGGAGADRMTGLAGADIFSFTAGEETGFVAEFITDYEIGIDTLTLSGFGFTSTNDLVFDALPSGDTTLQLTPSRFIVFETHTDQTTIEADASGWVFG